MEKIHCRGMTKQEYDKWYYQKNKEKIQQYNKEYRLSDKKKESILKSTACNVGLGMFEDSLLMLESASNYLQRKQPWQNPKFQS